MLFERIAKALNEHDIDSLVACFHPRYRSEQPAHPGRAFQGNELVRENWSALFRSIPDLRAELTASAVAGDTEWAEWHWAGTNADGTPFESRGVTVMGVDGDQATWARLYMEEVDRTGEDIDQAIKRWTRAEESP